MQNASDTDIGTNSDTEIAIAAGTTSLAVKTNTVCKGLGSGEARTEVLKEVNFEARLGELLMLVGPSGCGKTTLLSVIAGTLGVDRGEVEVFDSPLHRLDKRAVTQFRAAHNRPPSLRASRMINLRIAPAELPQIAARPTDCPKAPDRTRFQRGG